MHKTRLLAQNRLAGPIPILATVLGSNIGSTTMQAAFNGYIEILEGFYIPEAPCRGQGRQGSLQIHCCLAVGVPD